jgi:hypothetical protein
VTFDLAEGAFVQGSAPSMYVSVIGDPGG